MSVGALAHYRFVRKLGSGGMGEVYLADDSKLNRKVAIKILPDELTSDSDARRRLVREAKAAGGLDHPNICSVYEIGEEEGRAFIVMQYAEGETLAEVLKRGPLAAEESLDIAIQVADALAEAHSRGIVHRDIKPQNIIITRRGLVKVLDFGLAKISPIVQDEIDGETLSFQTGGGIVLGTMAYMSPEQARGEQIDYRSDLFSLGAVLYECFTGKRAFLGASPFETCASVLHSDPTAPSVVNRALGRSLDRLVKKALAKNTAARYQSAAEMSVELKRERSLLAERPTSVFGSSDIRRLLRLRFDRLTAGSRHRRLRIALAGLFVAAVAAIGVLVGWWPRTGHRPSTDAAFWHQRGVDALRNGSYYSASKAFERAIEIDSAFALAHARLAEAWLELDYTERAKDELLIATSLAPNRSELARADAMRLDAIAATVRRDFDGAARAYEQIAGRSDKSERPYAYLDLGRAHEKAADFEGASNSYKEALNGDPQYAAAHLRLAILEGRRLRLPDAERAFQEAEAIYRGLDQLEGVSEVLYQRGVLLNRLDRIAEARGQLDKSLEIARGSDNKPQTIKVLLQLSTVWSTAGDSSLARRSAEEAISIARANELEALVAGGLIDLGSACFTRSDNREAEEYFNRALEFAERKSYRRGRARAHLALASLRVQQARADEAIQHVEQALPVFEADRDLKETAQAQMILGRSRRQKGEYDAALQAFQEQLDLAEAIGDRSQIAMAHNSLGTLYSYQERYPEALKHFEVTIGINSSLGATVVLGYALLSRGTTAWQLGRYREAESDYEEALKIAAASTGGNKQLLAWVRMYSSRMEMSRRRFHEAAKLSREAVKLSVSEFNDLAAQARIVEGLASAKLGSGHRALTLCEEGLRLAEAAKSDRLIYGAQLGLAEVLVDHGNAERALSAALKAQEGLARFRQLDSEWRAWLAAARAAFRLGRGDQSRDYAGRASNILSKVRAEWGELYSTRPDVENATRMLETGNLAR
jgi:serine/threonine protein kinase/Tfp pilus assembly protein PilF